MSAVFVCDRCGKTSDGKMERIYVYASDYLKPSKEYNLDACNDCFNFFANEFHIPYKSAKRPGPHKPDPTPDPRIYEPPPEPDPEPEPEPKEPSLRHTLKRFWWHD